MRAGGEGTSDALVDRRVLMDAAAIDRALERIAGEIVERSGPPGSVALIGIRTGGEHLAARLHARIAARASLPTPPLGTVDITLYRDDVFSGFPVPRVGPTRIPFDVSGRSIVLVDDVLYTGRTVRAALDAIVEFGRPRVVQLAVLVDRGRRELPIQPDYVGLRVETRGDEAVRVRLAEKGEADCVVLRGAP